jgi:hypothetical protein
MQIKAQSASVRHPRRRLLRLAVALSLLPAAFGIGVGGHYALQAYSTLAVHSSPVACGGAMQPCVRIR